MSDLKKTPLNEWHKQNGARMVTYAGWEMPVQYSKGLIEEHRFTRSKASLFDVSHMGEFVIKGEQAYDFLSYMTPTNLDKLSPGEACYSFFQNDQGGVVDDLLIYRFEDKDSYMVCVNAANTDKVEAHLNKYSESFKVDIVNEGEKWGQIAIQGPEAVTMTDAVLTGSAEIKKFHFGHVDYKGERLWVARTGYTGEDGFEIFVPAAQTESLWKDLLGQGAEPCGLGARDTLRLEAALNLYGNELSEDCNPFERRMGWIVDFKKDDFLAKDTLIDLKEKATRTLTGLELLGRAIPRAGYEVTLDGEVVGMVTSGTMSPSFEKPIGMVWIDKKAAQSDKELKVLIRKREFPAKIVKLPFIKKNK